MSAFGRFLVHNERFCVYMLKRYMHREVKASVIHRLIINIYDISAMYIIIQIIVIINSCIRCVRFSLEMNIHHCPGLHELTLVTCNSLSATLKSSFGTIFIFESILAFKKINNGTNQYLCKPMNIVALKRACRIIKSHIFT